MEYRKVNYQTKAINQLLNASSDFFDYNEENQTIVFQAPTGSGKTFMLSKYMESLVERCEDKDFCFLWVSVGTGKLQEQSYNAVCEYTKGFLSCSLLENICFGGKTYINKGEVVFVNWEKLNNKDKQTLEWTNALMKDREQISFPSMLENTRQLGRKVILIIDESHMSATSETANRIRTEIIKPSITIESSATPLLKDYDRKVVVNAEDVINEGMMKEEILINPGIGSIVGVSELDSKELILEATYRKFNELCDTYKQEGSGVKPLVLLQIPNGEEGNDNIEFVKDFLTKKGITEENGKLAVWLADVKSETLSSIKSFESPVQFLIFKQAVATGWDCPRAQILVRFREVKSIIFETQTVGRILRTPEARKYDNHLLNVGYVYTNLEQIEVKQEKVNQNIIKSLTSERGKNYTSIKLTSYYHSRQGSYNDVDSTYYKFFDDSFKKYFGIETNETLFNINIDKMKEKGVDIYSIIPKESIIKDGVIKTIDADKEGKVVADKMMLAMSAMDLQNRFNNLIKENLNGLAYVRSLSTVKMAIAKAFNKYLGISPYDPNNMVFIQRVVLSYQNHFSIILDESIKSYKRSKEEFTNDGEDKYNESWEIPQYQMFNQNAYATKFSTISLHKPLYMLVNSNGKFDSIEEKFVEYLDSKNEFIEWFWHNGQEHMEQNFGIKYNKNSTFQPDFIIKFKNGKIGIFDTKSMTNNILDTSEKAEALQAYLKETNRNDLFGGIIINTNEASADKAPIFMINSKDKFVSFDNQPTDWEYFDKIFLK